jgi:hypothetical protein
MGGAVVPMAVRREAVPSVAHLVAPVVADVRLLLRHLADPIIEDHRRPACIGLLL